MTTNLALRPFRNERLPWLLAGLLITAALVTSFAQGRFISRLLSGDEANTVRVVREDEARIAELEEGIASEPPLRIEAAELARLHAFKELVDLYQHRLVGILVAVADVRQPVPPRKPATAPRKRAARPA